MPYPPARVSVAEGSCCRSRRRFYLHILQHDRLQRATASHLDQRRKVIVRGIGIEVDVGLNCRSAQIPVEDCPRRLELDTLVAAVQQLTQARDRARRQFRSLVLITSGTPGLPLGLALRPGSQCPWLVRSTMKRPLFLGPPAHVEGTNSLREARHGENSRAADDGGRALVVPPPLRDCRITSAPLPN